MATESVTLQNDEPGEGIGSQNQNNSSQFVGNENRTQQRTEDNYSEVIPEKFRSADDPVKAMADAYSELEKKLGSGPSGEDTSEPVSATSENTVSDEENSEDDNTGDNEEENKEQQEEEQQGFLGDLTEDQVQEMSQRFWETGELKEDDYTALEKAGIPKSLVDAYAEGQKALMEGQRQAIVNAAGGEEQLTSMVQWANENLSEQELQTYDKQINGSDANTAMVALKALKADYEAANGSSPKLMNTQASPGNKGESYQSVAELRSDMSDPRYKNDPAFRANVEKKLARSNIM